jgi:hypothetical protein
MFTARFLAVATVTLVVASFVLPVKADTILSVTGPHGSTLSLGAANQTLVTSWSSTVAYSNVSIGFQSNFGPFNGTAYLMTQIGPGTTSAQQVGTSSYSVISGTPSLTNLFSGLSLGPGSYYLVVTSGLLPPGGWDTPFTAGPAVVSTGVGVVRGAQYIVNDSLGSLNLAYLPASSFADLNSVYDLEFQVTGSPAAQVPEPSTLFLLGMGVTLLVTFRATLQKVG